MSKGCPGEDTLQSACRYPLVYEDLPSAGSILVRTCPCESQADTTRVGVGVGGGGAVRPGHRPLVLLAAR